MAKQKEYSADSIKVLDDIAHIRLRPGMYVGGADEVGHYIILKECIDNALDEALAGHADRIRVVLDEDLRGATVIDNGRGIPLEVNTETGLSTLAAVFAVAKSGAKFDAKTYGTSVGLHGVGATASNALSESFEATSFRNKKRGRATFQFGKLVGKDATIEKNDTACKTGTMIHLRPDYKNIFKDVAGFKIDEIRQRLQDTAYLLPDTTLEFQIGKASSEVLSGKGGLQSLLKRQANGATMICDPISISTDFEVEAEGKPATAELELCFSWLADSEQSCVTSFINLSRNPDGGTHAVGTERAITGFLVDRTKNKCSAKEILDGFICAIHLKHPAPQFSSQTKEKLINRELTKQIQEALEKELKSWARKNSVWVDEFLKSAIDRFNLREEEKDLKKALKDVKVTKRTSKGILPAKLFEADCRAEKRELYIVEGDGAAGSVVKGRDASYQEVLPLKGKILNVMKCSQAEALENKEIQAMIAAIGGGLGESFDLNKCRVGKLILLTDADSDGSHISSLVLSFLAKYMRPLLESGKVYSVDAPLFKAGLPGSTSRIYAHSMDDLKRKVGKSFSRYEVTRLKGHGEANAKEVAEYAMSPITRKLIQFSFNKDDLSNLQLLMADDVTARKELLGL